MVSAYASADTLVITPDEPKQIVDHATNHFRYLAEKFSHVRIESTDELDSSDCTTSMVIAYGKAAAMTYGDLCNRPFNIVDVTRSQAEEIKEIYPDVSGIYLEASPIEQLKLMVKNFQPPLRVLLPYTDAVTSQMTEVENYVAKYLSDKLTLFPLKTTSEHGPRDIRRVLDSQSIGAILLLPDPYLYNNRNLRPILFMSTNKRVPLVGGISPQFINAGVAMGMYSVFDESDYQLLAKKVKKGQFVYRGNSEEKMNMAIIRAFSIRIN